jgi:hypothetical protein
MERVRVDLTLEFLVKLRPSQIYRLDLLALFMITDYVHCTSRIRKILTQ